MDRTQFAFALKSPRPWATSLAPALVTLATKLSALSPNSLLSGVAFVLRMTFALGLPLPPNWRSLAHYC
jgi:hypothetical protein